MSLSSTEPTTVVLLNGHMVKLMFLSQIAQPPPRGFVQKTEVSAEAQSSVKTQEERCSSQL